MAAAPRLSLHVPEPTVRPGGRPDFSHVGSPRPARFRGRRSMSTPSDIRDLAYTIIRVLDENGEAVGAWAGSLDADSSCARVCAT